MDVFLKSLAELEVWQLGLAVLVVVAGSSATSAWITSSFQARTASKAFRREVRREALKAVGRSYALYLQYGSAAALVVTDPKRDQALAEAAASMHAAVAGLGKKSPLSASRMFALMGEMYAAQNEDTSISELDESFTSLISTVSNGIPAK
ncbi:hypothetical protein [Homoserinimonas sp. A520]